MKKILFLLALTAGADNIFSQSADTKYKARAEEVKQEIWGAPAKPDDVFRIKDVPPGLNNESAVIIARSFEIINSAKLKFKFGLFIGAARRLTYLTTIRERVKINDKTALDDYSSLEYQKKIDKTISFGFSKLYRNTDTYIGAKIIKPDGVEIPVNIEEEVLTKNESKDKQSKLAISGLQVGDILEYYIRREEIDEGMGTEKGPYTFVMGGEYPMLNYYVRFQLDSKVGVEYVSANNAPSFKQTATDDDDIVLELNQKNLPRFESKMWTSPLRQYPYITMHYRFLEKITDRVSHFNRGEVNHGFIYNDLVDEIKKAIQYPSNGNPAVIGFTEDYFGGKKKIKDVPEDSLAKVIYDAWKFNIFCNFDGKDIDVSNDRNYAQANSLYNTINMSFVLQYFNIDHDILLVCPRTYSSLKNVLEIGDFEGMIRINTPKPRFMGFDDMVTHLGEIPARFQGEEAITIHPDGGNKKRGVEYSDSRTKIPVSKSDENFVNETMQVSFAPSNMQQLQVGRTCREGGAMRHADQLRLLLLEKIAENYATRINNKNYFEFINGKTKNAKLADEYNAAFVKAAGEQKDHFKDEAQSQLNEEPKQLAECTIKDMALSASSPVFEYGSSFVMDNFVKKAGNNYIMEAGKLIGKYEKPDETERQRTIDIYMPCARKFSYDINISIPKGYRVKGVEELNKQVSNETGLFQSNASVNGGTLNINVTRVYTNNFEPAAKWPKLLELLDAVYSFNNQKVLLEKTQ